MSIRRFISVSPGFFVMAALLAESRFERPFTLILWIGVVTVGVLVHELGHAFFANRYGHTTRISLHAMGGTTSHEGRELSRWQNIAVSFGGPGFGLILGIAVWAAGRAIPQSVTSNSYVALVLADSLWINFGWTFINLLPILPLDGGQIARSLLGERRTYWVSLIFAAGLVTVGVAFRWFWAVVLLVWIGVINARSMWRHRLLAQDNQLEAQIKRADALLERDEHRAAMVTARNLLDELNSTVSRARAARIYLWAAIGAKDHEEISAALTCFPPAHPPSGYARGVALLELGRDDEALRDLAHGYFAQGVGAALDLLLDILVERGELDEALEILHRCDAKDLPANPLCRLQIKLFAEKRYGEAGDIGRKGFENTGHPVLAYNTACALSLSNNTKEAFDWLDRSLKAGFENQSQIEQDPDLNNLRDLPAFKALMEKIPGADRPSDAVGSDV